MSRYDLGAQLGQMYKYNKQSLVLDMKIQSMVERAQ